MEKAKASSDGKSTQKNEQEKTPNSRSKGASGMEFLALFPHQKGLLTSQNVPQTQLVVPFTFMAVKA